MWDSQDILPFIFLADSSDIFMAFKGTVQRDLRGGQKWYQWIDLPLIYQRFALDSNLIPPPS
jgi:hypothetical protein